MTADLIATLTARRRRALATDHSPNNAKKAS